LLLLVLFSRGTSGFVVLSLRGMNLLPRRRMPTLALLMMDAWPGMGNRAAHSGCAVCHARCPTYGMPTASRKAATSSARIHCRCAEKSDGDQSGGTRGYQRGCSHGDCPLVQEVPVILQMCQCLWGLWPDYLDLTALERNQRKSLEGRSRSPYEFMRLGG
jgi:hypothetical protein